MFTVCSLRRDTRFKKDQKLQTLMAIRASKPYKIWIFLNPSMCYSGYFSRISGDVPLFFFFLILQNSNGSVMVFFL